MKWQALNIALAIVSGFFLMGPLAWLFDRNNWPVFHSWGLAHGSFLAAWPMLTVLSYPPIALVSRLLRKQLRFRVADQREDASP